MYPIFVDPEAPQGFILAQFHFCVLGGLTIGVKDSTPTVYSPTKPDAWTLRPGTNR
jgi:hypothetical protein